MVTIGFQSYYFVQSLLNCVPYVLTCQCALRAYALTWLRALGAYVLTCQRALRAYGLTCQRVLRAYVLTRYNKNKFSITSFSYIFVIDLCLFPVK